MAVYNVGQEVRYLGTFRDTAGALTDPGTVRFYWQPPGAIGTVYSYGDGIVLRAAAGSFYIDRVHTQGGYVTYGWAGTATLTAADYARDFVRYLELT